MNASNLFLFSLNSLQKFVEAKISDYPQMELTVKTDGVEITIMKHSQALDIIMKQNLYDIYTSVGPRAFVDCTD